MPFFNTNKRISPKNKPEINKKEIYEKRINNKEKTFESFLSLSLSKTKKQNSEIKIQKIENFPEKVKEAIESFLNLLEKQDKSEYLSIIKQPQKRSQKTITGNIMTNTKNFLFGNKFITDINIFNNISLEKLCTIKKTTYINNEIFICSRSNITGKEKFEIIFSINKTNSVNYMAIIKITNSQKNNTLFESQEEYLYTGNNPFFKDLTLHSIESFIVNEGMKGQAESFLKELFLIKEKDIEFLRDIITLKFTEDKNKAISFLDRKFLENNLNLLYKQNKAHFWLAIPFDIDEEKANYI